MDVSDTRDARIDGKRMVKDCKGGEILDCSDGERSIARTLVGVV